jgi:hypothetical protein
MSRLDESTCFEISNPNTKQLHNTSIKQERNRYQTTVARKIAFPALLYPHFPHNEHY